MRILLVEDDRAISKEVKKRLASEHHAVDLCESGSEAYDYIRLTDYDVILMDIMLPFQNGYYWTAELRKESTVPIVFLSSASDQMNLVMAISMGGDDFIAKPFDR